MEESYSILLCVCVFVCVCGYITICECRETMFHRRFWFFEHMTMCVNLFFVHAYYAFLVFLGPISLAWVCIYMTCVRWPNGK